MTIKITEATMKTLPALATAIPDCPHARTMTVC
jgi:hypothetical protein